MSREKFEAWTEKKHYYLAYADCGYVYSSTEAAWKSWQAASKASEQQLAAVVAENTGLKKRTQQLVDVINKADNDYCMCGDAMKNHAHGGCGHPTGMFDYHYGKWLESGNETPATDAFLAELRAQGVEMYAMCIAHRVNYSEVDKSNELDALSFAEGLRNPAPELSPEEVVEFAAKLRQGAAL